MLSKVLLYTLFSLVLSTTNTTTPITPTQTKDTFHIVINKDTFSLFLDISLSTKLLLIYISIIIGITNIIPFFGPFIGAVPSIFLVLVESPKMCVVFIIFIIVLQQVDGNVIGPLILGDSTGLSPFWVIFSIMVGGGLFGFAGMLLGVPTFAVIYYIMQEILRYFLRKRDLPQDSSQYIELEKINVATNQPQYFQKEKETNEKDEEKA